MAKDNGCAGSYNVSGYTRSDGTQVSGYVRTCGAAHAGNSTNSSSTSNSKETAKEKIIREENERQEKMKRRASILYGSDEEYFNKYYGKNKESDVFKRLKDKLSDNFDEKLREDSIEQGIKEAREKEKLEEIRQNNFHFSDEEVVRAREFIQGREGLELKGYEDIAGIMTIGYGHTGLVDGKPITKDMVITKEKAEELYRKDFKIHATPLKKVKVPLTSNQKIALTSFIYNFGEDKFLTSTLYKKLNKGDYQGAANEFDIWIKARDPKTGLLKEIDGLKIRRKKEKKLFLTPDGE